MQEGRLTRRLGSSTCESQREFAQGLALAPQQASQSCWQPLGPHALAQLLHPLLQQPPPRLRVADLGYVALPPKALAPLGPRSPLEHRLKLHAATQPAGQKVETRLPWGSLPRWGSKA